MRKPINRSQRDIQNASNANFDYKNAANAFSAASSPAALDAALDGLRYIAEEDTLTGRKAISIFLDPAANKQLRIKALGKLYDYLYNRPVVIRKVIGLASSEKEPIELKRAALQALMMISFNSPALNSVMSFYKRGLREMMGQADPWLYEHAIEILAGYQDPYAVRKLTAGLKNHNEALVSDAKAIQLLGVQRSHGYSDLIRGYINKDRNPSILIEAVNALSSDQASIGAIRALLEDKGGDKFVRLTSLSALNSLSPDNFLEAAKNILSDDNDYADVKMASMNAINLQPRFSSIFQDTALNEKIRGLTAHENEGLRLISGKYLSQADRYLNESK